MPYINKLTLYPIKSLDGVEVPQAKITQGGALLWDRAFALYNKAGRTVNTKKYPNILKVRAQFDQEKLRVKLSINQQMTTLSMEAPHKIAELFSDYFGERVYIKQNTTSGFPDDDENTGPTIVSTATYLEVQKWFPELSLDSLRKRFRANIELGGCEEAFWEDRLFEEEGKDFLFQIGEVSFTGKKPCARCTVPTRDPFSSQPDKSFMRKFTEMREQTLPSFAHIGQFKHYYHLCVNTIIPTTESDKSLQVGDTFLGL